MTPLPLATMLSSATFDDLNMLVLGNAHGASTRFRLTSVSRPPLTSGEVRNRCPDYSKRFCWSGRISCDSMPTISLNRLHVAGEKPE